MSAVSISVTPSSIARWIVARRARVVALAGPYAHVMPMQPSPIAPASSPLAPSRRCGIPCSVVMPSDDSVRGMQVRVRLGAGLSRLSAAPLLTVELADGATVADLYARLRDDASRPRPRAALRPARRGGGARPDRAAPRPPRGGRPPAAGLRRLTAGAAMAIQDQTTAHPTVFVDTFTDGLLGPDVEHARPRGRRRPHRVEPRAGLLGADDHAGDPRRPRGLPPGRRRGRRASATRSRSASRTSRSRRARPRRATTRRWRAASTATRTARAVCPGCGAEWPETRLEGIGEGAVRCASCGADATPFTFTNGYTIAFDDRRRVGVTLPGEPAEALARDAARAAALPEHSVQNPILTFAPHDIVGARDAAAPVPRPARHVAVDDDPRLPQRGRLRRLPRRRAAPLRARRAGAAAPQDRRPPRHRRGPRRRRCSSARSRCRAAASTSATCTRSRATARSPATPPTSSGTVTLQVEVLKGLGIDGPGAVPGRRGPAVPRAAADARPSASRRSRSPAGTAWTRSRSRCRSA